jgi:hypothetical protein
VQSWWGKETRVSENEGRKPLNDLRLKRLEGRAQQVIVRVSPEDEDRRAQAASAWRPALNAPRNEPPATFDVPIDQRSQTILSHKLADDQRAKLQGAPTSAPDAAREGKDVAVPLHLRLPPAKSIK